MMILRIIAQPQRGAVRKFRRRIERYTTVEVLVDPPPSIPTECGATPTKWPRVSLMGIMGLNWNLNSKTYAVSAVLFWVKLENLKSARSIIEFWKKIS